MAIPTHSLLKSPQLSSFDRLELTVATTEKVLNSAAYLPGVNFVVAPIKFVLGLSQFLLSGSTLLIRQVGYTIKKRKEGPATDKQVKVFDNGQARFNNHLTGGLKNMGRAVIQVIPLANWLFSECDSDRYNYKKNPLNEAFLLNPTPRYPQGCMEQGKKFHAKIFSRRNYRYPAETKVLEEQFKKLGQKYDEIHFPPKKTTTRFDRVEYRMHGFERTLRLVGCIPVVNLLSGFTHFCYGVSQLVASVAISSLLKVAEAFSNDLENRVKYARLADRATDHIIASFDSMFSGIFEIIFFPPILGFHSDDVSEFSKEPSKNYNLTTLRWTWYTSRRIDKVCGYQLLYSYKGLRKIKLDLWNKRNEFDENVLRQSKSHTPLRKVESGMEYVEKQFFNKAGRIPVVSTLTGASRAVIGLAQIISGATIGVFFHIAHLYQHKAENYWHAYQIREDYFEFKSHGKRNFFRGLSEMIPFVGFAYSNHDKARVTSPLKSSGAYISERS